MDEGVTAEIELWATRIWPVMPPQGKGGDYGHMLITTPSSASQHFLTTVSTCSSLVLDKTLTSSLSNHFCYYQTQPILHPIFPHLICLGHIRTHLRSKLIPAICNYWAKPAGLRSAEQE